VKPAAPAKKAASKAVAAKASPAKAAPPPKPKLDPKDFIFLKRKGEKLVKAPGTINGQQFVIDSCEDCEIYVLDMCDSLMIDDCKNCKIVVGPTTGSIFIRDCEDCQCVFMCRQYRSRDCKNIDTYLHVTTRPIIETSSNMRFGCWDFHYAQLKKQMEEAGISAYQNFWSHIYNFNPDSATWSLLPPGAAHTSLAALEPLPEFPELGGVAEALEGGASPPLCVRTWGERDAPDASGEGGAVQAKSS
jgi:protein XRP2